MGRDRFVCCSVNHSNRRPRSRCYICGRPRTARQGRTTPARNQRRQRDRCQAVRPDRVRARMGRFRFPVSAVRHYSEKGMVVVRARDEESLTGLSTLAKVAVKKSLYNDYPYRVHVKDNMFQKWLILSAASMDYTNFKDRVHETRGDHFADVLMGVWDIMHEVEDEGARQ